MLHEHGARALVGLSSRCGDGRANRAPVVRIAAPRDETVRFQPVHQLGHVGLAAAVPFGELRQGERLGGEQQMTKRTQFGERETDLAERAFGPRLHGTRGVEEEQGESTSWCAISAVIRHGIKARAMTAHVNLHRGASLAKGGLGACTWRG